MAIESDLNFCEKCGCEISFGTPYYSIVRNLKFFSKNPETEETEIETDKSEEVICLCKSCGSVFNQHSLKTILKHLLIPGQETRN